MTAPMEVRVTLLDTWDEAVLRVPPTTLISELKRATLEIARIRRAPADYVVKYKGAEVGEGTSTLAEAGIGPNSSLIVLRRRRFPAR